MRSAAAALTLFAGGALAHQGSELHVHGLGIEHGLLFAAVLACLVYAVKK